MADSGAQPAPHAEMSDGIEMPASIATHESDGRGEPSMLEAVLLASQSRPAVLKQLVERQRRNQLKLERATQTLERCRSSSREPLPSASTSTSHAPVAAPVRRTPSVPDIDVDQPSRYLIPRPRPPDTLLERRLLASKRGRARVGLGPSSPVALMRPQSAPRGPSVTAQGQRAGANLYQSSSSCAVRPFSAPTQRHIGAALAQRATPSVPNLRPPQRSPTPPPSYAVLRDLVLDAYENPERLSASPNFTWALQGTSSEFGILEVLSHQASAAAYATTTPTRPRWRTGAHPWRPKPHLDARRSKAVRPTAPSITQSRQNRSETAMKVLNAATEDEIGMVTRFPGSYAHD